MPAVSNSSAVAAAAAAAAAIGSSTLGMEMRRSDSSGTDDDLPPAHSSQVRARVIGNGKAGSNGTKSIDHLVRTLEQEAYTAVLRAFGAQSEHITWAKERLISDLRKELRVTDEQHRDLLAKVSRDDSLRQIREWRESGDAPITNNNNSNNNNNNLALTAPPPLVPQARKKQKTGAVSQVPMPPPAPASAPAPAPPSKPLVASKKGAAVAGVPRGKSKGNSERAPAEGRGASQGKRKDCSSETPDRWIGQTVKVRWPEDNTFYEGYVRDFNKEDGTHTVIYDMGTEKESSERVNFSTIAAEDIKCNGAVERKKTYQTFKKREKPNSQSNSKPDRKPSQSMKLPSVDSLAKQVEELEHNADLNKIERAKRLAKEHEESIRKALLEVGESSDEDDSDGGGGRQRDGYRSMISNSVDEKDRRQH